MLRWSRLGRALFPRSPRNSTQFFLPVTFDARPATFASQVALFAFLHRISAQLLCCEHWAGAMEKGGERCSAQVEISRARRTRPAAAWMARKEEDVGRRRIIAPPAAAAPAAQPQHPGRRTSCHRSPPSEEKGAAAPPPRRPAAPPQPLEEDGGPLAHPPRRSDATAPPQRNRRAAAAQPTAQPTRGMLPTEHVNYIFFLISRA